MKKIIILQTFKATVSNDKSFKNNYCTLEIAPRFCEHFWMQLKCTFYLLLSETEALLILQLDLFISDHCLGNNWSLNYILFWISLDRKNGILLFCV